MSADGYFPLKQRAREAKKAIRLARSFEHNGAEAAEVEHFFWDLIENLSEHRSGEVEETRAWIIRMLGVIVECEAQASYEAYGYACPLKIVPDQVYSHAPEKLEADEPVWTWPVIEDAPQSSGSGFSGAFRQFSALKMFGYTVGKTSGWAARERRAFLDDFMNMDLPSIVAETFGDEYGKPMSITRLRKVANVIASNANLRWRSDPGRYAQAIADWEADLEHLHDAYYMGHGLQFQPWPDSKS